MADAELKTDVKLRRKRHEDSFSNYEKAVSLICSLEAWIEYRWGTNGKEKAGLLEYFNRFPHVEGLTPDFEVKFRTPYIIWGDHKQTIQPAEKEPREDTHQIVTYATRAVSEGCTYDVLVIVNSENDNVAARAISSARENFLKIEPAQRPQPQPQSQTIAPIVVLGCYLNMESSKEWYILKWREHYDNGRFSTPNVCADPVVHDLNKLICDATHLAIPVNRPVMDLAGRNPFINDAPPPMYTAVRLVIPVINSLLTDDDRDALASSGRVEKTLTRLDLMNTDLVSGMKPRPPNLESWLGAALDFLSGEVTGTAKKVPNTEPQQYTIVVDGALLKSDFREFFSDRAAYHSAVQAAKSKRAPKRKGRDNNPNQGNLFE